MKLRIYLLLGVLLPLSSCSGIKYCENQNYDYLDADFNPCKASSAVYKQNIIKAEGIPRYAKRRLISSVECEPTDFKNEEAIVPTGIYDNLNEGTRRIYDNGKLKFEILPTGINSSILQFNDYTGVSEEKPYYRTWFFSNFSEEIILMRVNYLGKANGYADDFILGMLKFEKFNSYVGLVRREVRIAFDHEDVLKEYMDFHSSQVDSWLYTQLAFRKMAIEIDEALRKEQLEEEMNKRKKKAAKRARKLDKRNRN